MAVKRQEAFMGKFARPEVVVSRCLGFESCRYNAQTVPSNFVSTLGNFVNYTTVCPEVDIGLGVPRAPIRLIALDSVVRLIQPSTGLDVTEKMNAYASSLLSSLENVDELRGRRWPRNAASPLPDSRRDGHTSRPPVSPGRNRAARRSR